MNRTMLGVAFLLSVLGATGCGPDPDVEAEELVPADELATTEEALTIDGMTVLWKYVGSPTQANKIAACKYGSTDVVYALNNDYRLYKGDGTNTHWVYRGYPSAARDIACTSSSTSWIWAINFDKKFYFNVYSGADASWKYEGTASGAKQIGNGGLLSALNNDGSVWTYDNATKAWTYRAKFVGATEASAARIGGSGAYRWFVVKNGDVQFTNGVSTALTAFPITSGVPAIKLKVRDVSSPLSDEVWALTENRRLYKARFVETYCKDAKDNDVDGRKDGYDSDCVTPLGKEVCTKFHKTGNFCISRLGIPSNALAKCSGSTLVGTQVGDWCTQVGAGGSDTVGYVQ